MTEAPPTAEGWYVAHDFRRIDWDAWRGATDRQRRRAIEDGVAYLERHEQVVDSEAGESAVFTILGHEADLLVVHMRPTADELSAAERAFETTELASYTERADSYVSVTEVSGYVSDEYFGDGEVDEGTRRYIEGKLEPEIPDDTYVSFYPMSKRREPEANWYTLSFEKRAELMAEHGETGREYAGDVSQVISSSVGFESFEWGVTLFADDPATLKDIVYEMRFDEVSAVYGEFGDFFFGRRFPPTDLGALLAGEPVPTDDETAHGGRTDAAHGSAQAEGASGSHGDAGAAHSGGAHGESGHEESGHGGGGSHSGGGGGRPAAAGSGGGGAKDAESIRSELAELDIYAGQPHGEDVFATVLYSEADPEELFEEVRGLRANFDHYGTHVKTAVYEGTETDRSAVVSIWETASAAETAGGFLSELPGVVERAGDGSDFGTMGMFYTVVPDHREDFVDRFDTVGDELAEMDGHHETDLLVNREDENDMFIASQWAAKDDAMEFFRSEDFRDTVEWGREVLNDRPRHVFLA